MAQGPETTSKRTRFARVYGDGSMGIEPAGTDYFSARRSLCDGRDDDDVELLEVEVVVIRSHGKPKLAAVKKHSCTCPTCGEEITLETPHAD